MKSKTYEIIKYFMLHLIFIAKNSIINKGQSKKDWAVNIDKILIML